MYGSADWELALAQAAALVSSLQPSLIYIGGLALAAAVVDLLRRLIR